MLSIQWNLSWLWTVAWPDNIVIILPASCTVCIQVHASGCSPAFCLASACLLQPLGYSLDFTLSAVQVRIAWYTETSTRTHTHTHTFCWFTLFPPFVSSYWPRDLDSWYIMKRGVVYASVSSKSFSRITKLASCIPSVLVADQWFGARNIAASAISIDHKGFSGETIADQCWHVLLSLDKLARQTKAKRETVLFCWFSPVQTKLAK